MESNMIVKRGRDIGFVGQASYYEYVWAGCLDCKKPKWRRIRKGEIEYPLCGSCAAKRRGMRRGDKHPNWKGGIISDGYGYKLIKVPPDSFFISMSNSNNYIYEHRLEMAKFLGRCLHSWEVVHHKNHIRDDNRIENLQLVSDLGHKQINLLETKMRKQAILISGLREELKGERAKRPN